MQLFGDPHPKHGDAFQEAGTFIGMLTGYLGYDSIAYK